MAAISELRSVHSFVFSSSLLLWQPVLKDGLVRKTPQKKLIRLAAYNVLHDDNSGLLEYFLQSPKRNQHMIKLITELDADIICLNEVTVPILNMILANQIIRGSYFVSDIPSSPSQTVNLSIHEKCTFGNILLSRLPFEDLHSYLFVHPTCKRKVIFGLFSHCDQQFLVGGVHATAHRENQHIRKQQIDEIVDVLKRSDHFNFGNNIFLMGDFNFHSEEENASIEPYFIDLWKSTHQVQPATLRSVSSMLLSYVPYSAYFFPPVSDEEEGYTFDSLTNTMIPYYVPFERRRMRLDRIIMKEGCQFKPTDKMHRFGDHPVQPGYYLFASDHYGLYIDLETLQNGDHLDDA